MDQGNLRADVNLSLAPRGTGELGTRTETKNVNSFRSVERAVRYEMQRHAGVLDGGGSITAGDPPLARGHRRHHQSGREKSDAEDYRYFPEPDLVPVAPSREWVEELRGRPARERRARSGPGCRPSGASPTSRCATPSAPARSVLVEETIAAGAAAAGRPEVVARRAGPPRQRRRASRSRSSASRPAEVARRPGAGRRGHASTTSSPARSSTACSPARARPSEIVAARGLEIVSDEGALGAAVDNAIAANPDVADKIRDGKVAAAGALIGAVMKEMRGQADANRVRELILEKLSDCRVVRLTDGSIRRSLARRPGWTGWTSRCADRCRGCGRFTWTWGRGVDRGSRVRAHTLITPVVGGSRSESGADPQP